MTKFYKNMYQTQTMVHQGLYKISTIPLTQLVSKRAILTD